MDGCQKDLVQLYWTGYYSLPIHGRDPATARHGDFCLLRFRPGPVRLSLVNLDADGSPPPTILMPGLARTPGRHRPVNGRCPALKLSTDPGLPVAGLQEHATTPGRSRTVLILLSIVQPVFSPIGHTLIFGFVHRWNLMYILVDKGHEILSQMSSNSPLFRQKRVTPMYFHSPDGATIRVLTQ